MWAKVLTEQRQLFTCFLMIIILGLTSCMGGGRAPVYSREQQKATPIAKKPIPQKVIPRAGDATKPVMRKNYYQVVRGDTLYSIAWRYKLDYKKLAKWNSISTPYVIHVGKKLRLIPPPAKPVRKIVKTEKPANYQKPKPPPVSKKPETKTGSIAKQAPVVKQTQKLPAKISQWQWPTKGKLVSSDTVSGRNGIDIKGKMGQTVKAAAAGNVVYSGSGLVGYGNLIIIKHNKTFLSAYAHNSRLLVNEGTTVSAGQPIAEMGNTGTNMTKLHFEIRKDGKSVDPLKYLPK